MTRATLDLGACTCGKANCDARNTAIVALCCPGSGLAARFLPATGHLVLACATCGLGVCRIQVAWVVPS